MNKYLNSGEKENMIRLDIMHGLLAGWIKEKAKRAKSTEDKTLLRYLRTADTWFKKAYMYRFNHLDDSQKKALARSVAHLDFEIVPNDKAHAVKKRMADFESTMVVKTDDWLDWLEIALPLSCGLCDHDENYENCRYRKLLMKYATPAVNDSAKGCQYSFKDAGYDVQEMLDGILKHHHDDEKKEGIA